jgi:DNA-binding SARP family transcriptional activator
MQIRLLGPLAIEDGPHKLGPADLGGRKPKQILEILLTERGHVVSKDRIADQLWPEGGPENPAATIDTYVSVLRRHLEPTAARAKDSRYVRSVSPGYLFDAAGAEIDADRFQRLMTEGEEAHGAGELERAYHTLIEAIDQYQGSYLEDEPYAPWTEEPRRYFERSHLALLVRSAELAMNLGDFHAGVALAERAINRDPIREEAYRTSLLCSYALGRREEALRTYRRCRKALAEELGIDPTPDTEWLHERVLAGIPVQQLLAPLGDQAPRRRSGTVEVPFLGRRAELAALLEAWQATAEGDTPGVRLALVEGEAGIGKSRLVSEFLQRTQIRCGRAKCTELDRDLPFSGLAAALADLFRALPPRESERALQAGPAIRELVPELGNDQPSAMTALPPEAARTRLLDSVAAALQALSPLALFLDDLHWSDVSTVQALGRTLQRVRTAPILLVAGLRPVDARKNPPVGQLADVARSEGRLQVIDLVPLPRSALDALVPLGVDALELWATTGGHPLFITERLRAGTGERLDETILSRCRTAPASAQRALEAASMFERTFRPGHLAAMLKRDETSVAADLEELLSRKLLVEHAGELAFSHDLVRDTVLQSVSAPRREALHRRALQTLEAEGAEPAELARHALEGGIWKAAVRYATEAGDRALELYANAEAAAHFERALGVLRTHPGLADAEHTERLRIRRARALIVLGQTDEAAALLEQAVSSARRRGDPRAEAEAVHWLARSHWAAWYPSRALPHAQRALELAEQLGDARLVGQAHAFLANPHGSLGKLDKALEHAGRALETFAQLGADPPAIVLYRIGIVRHQRGQELAALEALRHGEELALQQHDEITLVFVRWVRATALANLGRYGEALAALASAESAGRGEEVFARSRIPNTYGACYADLELWDEAREHDLESLDEIQSMGGAGVQEPRIHTLLNLAEDYLALGDPDGAAGFVRQVEGLVPYVEYARFRYLNRLQYVRALLALAQEELPATIEAADACLSQAAVYAAPKYEVRGRLVRGRALARLSQVQDAERELIAAAQLAERLSYPTWARRAWDALAALTDSPRARRCAQTAARTIADGLDTGLREKFMRTSVNRAR